MEMLDAKTKELEKKLEKWNNNMKKRRMGLIESIEKEKESKGKRKCVLRALDYLKEM